MDRHPFLAHTLVLLAALSGVVGMGIVFRGAMDGNLIAVSRGLPFLLMGLWWAGRQLSRSMVASEDRRRRPTSPTGERE